MEINGDSTAGMTHSQAVEQIRRGGHRIHLVLKRGNGYVPDYGEGLGVTRDVTATGLQGKSNAFTVNRDAHVFFFLFGTNSN